MELYLQGSPSGLRVSEARLCRGLGRGWGWSLQLPVDHDGTGRDGEWLFHASQTANTPVQLRAGGKLVASGVCLKAAWRDEDETRAGWEVRLGPPARVEMVSSLARYEKPLALAKALGVVVQGAPTADVGLPAALNNAKKRFLIVEGLSRAEAAERLLNDLRRTLPDATSQVCQAEDLAGQTTWDQARPQKARAFLDSDGWPARSPAWTLRPMAFNLKPDAGDGERVAGASMESAWRDWDGAEFQQWLQVPLPVQWVGGPRPCLIHRSTEVLRTVGNHKVEWQTRLEQLAEGTLPELGPGLPAWLGLGRCRGEMDEKGRVPVSLFTAAPIPMPLLALYTGKKGKTGLNLPPAVDTEVLVHWSGRTQDPPYCLGNVRTLSPAHRDRFLDLPEGLGGLYSGGVLTLSSGQNITLTGKTVQVNVSGKMEVNKK